MTNSGAILSTIISSNDPQYLLGLVTDDLFTNYKLYSKESVESSTYDYTTLSNKVAYDSFINSSVVTVASNIQTETNRVKSTLTYAKQYILVNNVKHYSYRILSEDTPIVVTANATSTISPSGFTSDIQTVEQTFTLNILKTTVIQRFIANTRDDFLVMPSSFASPDIMYTPNATDTYFALKVMLLNYYGSDVSTAISLTGSALIGASLVLGVAALALNFKWNAFALFASTTLLPVILVFIFNSQNNNSLLVEKINIQLTINQYLIVTGIVGTIVGAITTLYSLYSISSYRINGTN